MATTFTLSEAAREVLRRSTFAEGWLTLPPGQLPRALYLEVNKVLEGAGGRWDRKARAHAFPAGRDPRPLLLRAVEDGIATNHQQALQAFYTPSVLACRMASLAQIQRGECVLEPSAGTGRLALAAREYTDDIVCLDSDPQAVYMLCSLGLRAQCQDFLTVTPAEVPGVDVVLMNPPFQQGAEVAHVIHGLSFLRPGGRLVAIMSNGITFRKDKASSALRATLAAVAARIEPLPEKSFAASGTTVNTVLVQCCLRERTTPLLAGAPLQKGTP